MRTFNHIYESTSQKFYHGTPNPEILDKLEARHGAIPGCKIPVLFLALDRQFTIDYVKSVIEDEYKSNGIMLYTLEATRPLHIFKNDKEEEVEEVRQILYKEYGIDDWDLASDPDWRDAGYVLTHLDDVYWERMEDPRLIKALKGLYDGFLLREDFPGSVEFFNYGLFDDNLVKIINVEKVDII
jgi:hypothetical protein